MFSSSVTVAVLLTLVLESGDLIPGGGGSVSATHHLMYVSHFLTKPQSLQTSISTFRKS